MQATEELTAIQTSSVDYLSRTSSHGAFTADLETGQGGKSNEAYFQFLGRTFSELKRFKFALATNVLNTLSRRYRRSVLGFGWSLVGPFMTMIVMTIVFAALFKRDLHTFAMYIFSGILPWQFMAASITNSSQSILGNESFLKKIFVPKAFFPVATVCTEAFNFVFSLSSFFILAVLLGLSIKWTIVLVPFAVVLTTLFLCGIGLTMAVATVYFRDLTHITNILLSIVFYLMPILYPETSLPNALRFICTINPFYHFITLFRLLINDGVVPSPVQWLTTSGLAISMLFVGLLILKRTEKRLIFRL